MNDLENIDLFCENHDLKYLAEISEYAKSILFKNSKLNRKSKNKEVKLLAEKVYNYLKPVDLPIDIVKKISSFTMGKDALAMKSVSKEVGKQSPGIIEKYTLFVAGFEHPYRDRVDIFHTRFVKLEDAEQFRDILNSLESIKENNDRNIVFLYIRKRGKKSHGRKMMRHDDIDVLGEISRKCPISSFNRGNIMNSKKLLSDIKKGKDLYVTEEFWQNLNDKEKRFIFSLSGEKQVVRMVVDIIKYLPSPEKYF